MRAIIGWLVLVALLALVPPATSVASSLPLGPPTLVEQRGTTTLAAGVTWTRIARGRPSIGGRLGPWQVNVLRISHDAAGGRAGVGLSNGIVPARESLTALAARSHALAAVNGGYFASVGRLDGDPVGALAVGGQLVSEPVAGRGSLLLPAAPGGRPTIASLNFAGSVAAGGARRLLDGVNRTRGLVAGCGGRGGDRPTQRPDPVLVCTDASELILFTPSYGARTRTPLGGVEAVVRDDVVRTVRAGGNSAIPRDGYVLSGSGDAAGFLSVRLRPGTRPSLSLAVRTGNRLVRPEAYGGIVSGGPRLLAGGRALALPGDARDLPPSYYVVRGPRTLAGVTATGDLLLVTVDGRSPARSVGVTLTEAARLMQGLGAHDALNLDGGGSTTMVVGGRVVNRPSDPGGPRGLSDGVVVVRR